MKIQVTKQGIVALALGWGVFLNAKETLPTSVGALGDSITAGAFASFNRNDAHNPFSIPKFLFFVGKIGYTRSLRAVESRSRVWATGMSSKILSHANRLLEIANDGRKLALYNAAVSGATSNDLKPQVDALLSWANSLGQGAPDYITIEIGANDACAKTNSEMTSVSRFENNLRSTVYRILEANPKSRILISGIPNVEHLRNVAKDSLLMGIPPAARCRDMWKIHGFCKNMLQESDPQKRAEISRRIRDFMYRTELLVQEANDEFGDDQVRFAPEVYAYKFTDNEISIDCFHPNREGHEALSEVLWQKSWWN